MTPLHVTLAVVAAVLSTSVLVLLAYLLVSRIHRSGGAHGLLNFHLQAQEEVQLHPGLCGTTLPLSPPLLPPCLLAPSLRAPGHVPEHAPPPPQQCAQLRGGVQT